MAYVVLRTCACGLLCRGRYAQLFAESKSLTEDEEQLFDASALHAYESFRNKAAESRGMDQDAMQVGLQGSEGRETCLREWARNLSQECGGKEHVHNGAALQSPCNKHVQVAQPFVYTPLADCA